MAGPGFNRGLLPIQGLIEGLNSGIKTYRDESRYYDERDEKRAAREEAMEMKRQGLLSEERRAQESMELRKEQMIQNALLRRQMNEQSDYWRRIQNELQTTKMNEERDKRDERDVQELGDKVGQTGNVLDAVSGIEKEIGSAIKQPGFRLDDATTEGGLLKVGGKEVDLPGVNIPGIGRVSAYSTDARKLDTAMAKVFNVELKDRSGAAVTNPEMERMKQEFAQGKFNTEPEMIRAMKEYRDATARELARREAAFRPEVVDRYRSRGGVTSKEIGGNGLLREPKDSAGGGGLDAEAAAAVLRKRQEGKKGGN